MYHDVRCFSCPSLEWAARADDFDSYTQALVSHAPGHRLLLCGLTERLEIETCVESANLLRSARPPHFRSVGRSIRPPPPRLSDPVNKLRMHG
jgi:hypothetical protein